MKFYEYGRLTKDVEVRVSQNGNSIARFTIASNRDKDTTDFHNCIASGKTADTIGKYFHKGSRIVAYGEVHNNNWTDKDGNKHYDESFFVTGFEFVDSKNENKNEVESTDFGKCGDGFVSVPDGIDEELPFR